MWCDFEATSEFVGNDCEYAAREFKRTLFCPQSSHEKHQDKYFRVDNFSLTYIASIDDLVRRLSDCVKPKLELKRSAHSRKTDGATLVKTAHALFRTTQAQEQRDPEQLKAYFLLRPTNVRQVKPGTPNNQITQASM